MSWFLGCCFKKSINMNIIKILYFGNTGSGKSSIIQLMKSNEVNLDVSKTAYGYVQNENISFDDTDLTLCEINTKNKIDYVSYHFYGALGVIYVIDSVKDKDSMELLKDHIEKINMILNKTPILIYANKQDLEDAMPISQIKDELGLENITDREVKIVPCCASATFFHENQDSNTIQEGLRWLLTECL
eukprot:TRINITY_DN13694_c0_g1_i1.p1 TRINITY_DN13694_c0_g1~~TRINITY_DN13694_c0_g1_i1.p1  ORF type:complete len:188 (-),score=28.81 TRINITY_DN13694_c0_g1_i1:3-566(-)